jgi:hypothetical protein
MAASPYRSTCTIAGTAFDALEIYFGLNTPADNSGMPQMGGLQITVRVVADFHDDQNLPFGTLNSLFNLANVATISNIQPMKLEYWQDDSKQNALCSISFSGFISKYQTCNPAGAASGSQFGTGSGANTADGNVNHMLILELTPVMNQQNFSNLTFSN